MLIPDGFFNLHLSRRMCNQFTFHHQFRIDTGRTNFEQQTDMDSDTIDLNAPRHAQYMHEAWKRHQNTVYWVDINLAIAKGLKFYQTRSNAIILHETLPPNCIPKVVRMETGTVIYEKENASPRPPPKISLKHDWKRELGSEDAQRPDGQVVQQFKSFQSNQRQTQIMIERGNPLLKQEHPKHVHLMPARASTFKLKRHMVERGNPL